MNVQIKYVKAMINRKTQAPHLEVPALRAAVTPFRYAVLRWTTNGWRLLFRSTTVCMYGRAIGKLHQILVMYRSVFLNFIIILNLNFILRTKHFIVIKTFENYFSSYVFVKRLICMIIKRLNK